MHPLPPLFDRPPWNWIRRGFAFAVLLALAVIVAWSYVPGAAIASCHQELAAGGAVVKLCGPIGAGDIVGVGLVLLIAGLLVWPDLSELGIPGLIALKRRVVATERAQEQTADDVRSLSLAQEVPDLGEIRKELSEQLQRWSELPDDVRVVPTGSERPATVPADARVISTDRADSEARLLRLSREIDGYLRLASHEAPERMLRHPSWRRRLPEGLDADRYIATVHKWATELEGPLQLWAAIRNVAVHYPERLSDESIPEALRLGESLLDSLERFGAPRLRELRPAED